MAGADISRRWSSTFANTAWSRLGSYKGGGVSESTGNCRSPPFGLKPGSERNNARHLQSLETAKSAVGCSSEWWLGFDWLRLGVDNLCSVGSLDQLHLFEPLNSIVENSTVSRWSFTTKLTPSLGISWAMLLLSVWGLVATHLSAAAIHSGKHDATVTAHPQGYHTRRYPRRRACRSPLEGWEIPRTDYRRGDGI